MGQIKKIGEVYYIEFYARGLMYSQVGGSTQQDAQRLLDQIESKIAGGEALTIVREIDLIVFFENFLKYARDEFSPKSLKRFSLMWQHFQEFLSLNYPHVTQLSQITPAVVESYKANLLRTTKPKVINLTILMLREILEYGIKIGFLNDNATLHIRLLETSQQFIIKGRRFEAAKDLLSREVGLAKVYKILKLTDIAQIIYWSKFIPLKREDVYN